LSPDQGKNLLSFLKLVPKEMVADFYQKFLSDCKAVCTQWYSGPDRAEIIKYVLSALTNPQTGRGQ
jgi:hypothetical protein